MHSSIYWEVTEMCWLSHSVAHLSKSIDSNGVAYGRAMGDGTLLVLILNLHLCFSPEQSYTQW